MLNLSRPKWLHTDYVILAKKHPQAPGVARFRHHTFTVVYYGLVTLLLQIWIWAEGLHDVIAAGWFGIPEDVVVWVGLQETPVYRAPPIKAVIKLHSNMLP